MSDEDSLSEMHVAPQRLMPKSSSLTEHHKVLNLSAVHAGNTIATFKAHKTRIDDLEERLEEVEEVKDMLWGLRSDMSSQKESMKEHMDQFSRAITSQGAIIGDINQKLASKSSDNEIKKMVIAGVLSLLMAIVTAYCGYTWGHPSPTKYDAPTHQQAIEIDEKLRAQDPDNIKRQYTPR